ncbi:preprotein translocase subunit SecG [Qiania dongpingensis]|uniref:Protein-export membrane protein SecG n=1 Tax=Qiania dongpingensis TaxID=2763669 RepID=A0A7G9G5L0_9FIRM|nr:preprotein translocase subunit SecG [Qiania dongpingensis]QNM06092.1 preprotein translocase subunit SecG [Qiania dongpingensis]
MTVLKVILTVVFLMVCLALVVIVLLQEGKSAGLTGSISGAAETFWGKNKGRSIEGKLEKVTKYAAILFLLLALVLNIL